MADGDQTGVLAKLCAHSRKDSEEIIGIISKMREAVKECKLTDCNDEFLAKWLIVQDLNVDRAVNMLKQSLEWRRVNGLDDIFDWNPPEVLVKYFPYGKLGVDKLDCPVYLCAHGRIDLRGLLQAVSMKEYMRYLIWLMEMANREMRQERMATGKNPWCQMTYIGDLGGYTMRQITYKPLMVSGLEWTKINSAYYPENSRMVFMINAPRLFMAFYNVVKPFLPQATLDKIRVFGCNKDEWSAALLEEIDADQLPVMYGGTAPDPEDASRPVKLNMGGEVPSMYFKKNNTPVIKDYMETINIKAGAVGKKKLKFSVDVKNSTLRWEFITEGGNIGFRIYFKNHQGETLEIIPLDKVESHMDVEEGEIVCDDIGTYVVVFDNTHSYLRSKKVHYSIAIKRPPVEGDSDIIL